MDDPLGTSDEAIRAAHTDVAALVADNANLRDRYLSALAEAENTRGHAQRQTDEAKNLRRPAELLLVADNLQRAIAAAEADIEADMKRAAGDSLLEGEHATHRLLTDDRGPNRIDSTTRSAFSGVLERLGQVRRRDVPSTGIAWRHRRSDPPRRGVPHGKLGRALAPA